MARRLRTLTSEFPYHITSRCINREWFQIPLHDVWKIFCDYLYYTHLVHNLRIHAFVLMNNHFHLIASTPSANIGEAMCCLLTKVSCEISRQSGRINQTFGGPYFSSVLSSELYYEHAYKYVYRNPVDAGIEKCVHRYQYSTLNGILGESRLLFPIEEDRLLTESFEKTIQWLNQGYQDGNRQVIKNALKRNEFKISNDRKSRKPHPLEHSRS